MTEIELTPLKTNNDKLEDEINTRRNQVVRYAAFVEEIVRAYGETLKDEQCSCHTKVLKEIKDFGGFHLVCYWGHSMMGGNDVKIFESERPRMKLYYQASLAGCKLQDFDTESEWQKKFENLIANKEQVVSEFLQKQNDIQDLETQMSIETNRKDSLMRQASDWFVPIKK